MDFASVAHDGARVDIHALPDGAIRPDRRTITRQDVYFGIVAETPLGVITFAPSIGDGGNRKLNFTLGRLF